MHSSFGARKGFVLLVRVNTRLWSHPVETAYQLLPSAPSIWVPSPRLSTGPSITRRTPALPGSPPQTHYQTFRWLTSNELIVKGFMPSLSNWLWSPALACQALAHIDTFYKKNLELYEIMFSFSSFSSLPFLCLEIMSEPATNPSFLAAVWHTGWGRPRREPNRAQSPGRPAILPHERRGPAGHHKPPARPGQPALLQDGGGHRPGPGRPLPCHVHRHW